MVTYQRYASLRDAAGLNDFKVSNMTGISPATISDWKTGKSTPKTDKLLKIAAALNVTLNDLVEQEVET